MKMKLPKVEIDGKEIQIEPDSIDYRKATQVDMATLIAYEIASQEEFYTYLRLYESTNNCALSSDLRLYGETPMVIYFDYSLEDYTNPIVAYRTLDDIDHRVYKVRDFADQTNS